MPKGMSQRREDCFIDDFACRTSIDPWMLALPLLAAIVISLVAVGHQSLRAVAADPVDSLKYE